MAIEELARAALNRLASRRRQHDGHAPVSPRFVDGFCRLLVGGTQEEAARALRAVTRNRPAAAQIADALLSAAAARLGQKWQAGDIAFAEVTLAVSRIFRLNQAYVVVAAPVARDPGRAHAVFATLPGQAHNLGLVLAAEAFRQDGWDITLMLDAPAATIVERVRRLRPEAVGLSISAVDRVQPVALLIRELRAQPNRFRIILGGTGASGLAQGLPQGWRIEVAQDIATARRDGPGGDAPRG